MKTEIVPFKVKIPDCAYCGGKGIPKRLDEAYWIQCEECGIATLCYADKRRALARWRQRAHPAMPRPDWRQAPAWAQWWAVDSTNSAWWFEDVPEICTVVDMAGFWARTTETRMQAAEVVDLPLGIDWRTTLLCRCE